MDGFTSRPAKPIVALRLDRYRDFTRAKGWITQEQQAQALNVGQNTISRVLAGIQQRPGPTFIAAVLTAFPEAKFEDLFEIVTEGVLAVRPARQDAAA